MNSEIRFGTVMYLILDHVVIILNTTITPINYYVFSPRSNRLICCGFARF